MNLSLCAIIDNSKLLYFLYFFTGLCAELEGKAARPASEVAVYFQGKGVQEVYTLLPWVGRVQDYT